MNAQRAYRAHHIGSLLRPQELIDARDAFKAGKLPHEELQVIEDRCIRDLVAMQESLGLKSVTDGEFRHSSIASTDFILGLEGTELGPESDVRTYYTPKAGAAGIRGRKTYQ